MSVRGLITSPYYKNNKGSETVDLSGKTLTGKQFLQIATDLGETKGTIRKVDLSRITYLKDPNNEADGVEGIVWVFVNLCLKLNSNLDPITVDVRDFKEILIKDAKGNIDLNSMMKTYSQLGQVNPFNQQRWIVSDTLTYGCLMDFSPKDQS